MQNVYRSLLQVLSTAEVCAEKGVELPALILLYSTMDSMGWMVAENPKAQVKQRFVSWVNTYALPASAAIQCTALELYAARCGVLHTFTADSDLSDKGTRRIVYAWGNAPISSLHKATYVAGNDKWVAVHLSDLTEAVRLGIAQMFEDARTNPALAARLEERGARFFESVDQSALEAPENPDPSA